MYDKDYDNNPYREERLPAQPEPLGRLLQAAIALLFALAAIYLAS
jgi:hypothetical protein